MNLFLMVKMNKIKESAIFFANLEKSSYHHRILVNYLNSERDRKRDGKKKT